MAKQSFKFFTLRIKPKKKGHKQHKKTKKKTKKRQKKKTKTKDADPFVKEWKNG